MKTVKVTFVEAGGEVRTIESAEVGHTLMEVAKAHGVEGVMGDCGGGCACATCHVYVDPAWMELVGAPDDIESEMLDMVSDTVREGSRLSCQIRLSEELDGLRVRVVDGS